MKRMPLIAMMLIIPAVCMFLVVGCRTDTKTETTVGKTTPTDKTTPQVKAEPIKTATEATVTGVVKYDGEPPAQPEDPRIAKHKEGPDCLKGNEIDKQEQVWIVGKDGGVANVVISLA